MNDKERRARWLANWAGMGMEAAAYLCDRGHEQEGESLECAVVKILDLAGEEIGEDVLSEVLQEINDLWCEGENLAEDYFAEDGPPVDRMLH